jgi:hypothetical protein
VTVRRTAIKATSPAFTTGLRQDVRFGIVRLIRRVRASQLPSAKITPGSRGFLSIAIAEELREVQ